VPCDGGAGEAGGNFGVAIFKGQVKNEIRANAFLTCPLKMT
jgi:hypothetical protein